MNSPFLIIIPHENDDTLFNFSCKSPFGIKQLLKVPFSPLIFRSTSTTIMFNLRTLISLLTIITIAWTAAVPSAALPKRQGSCISALARPNPVNNVGRISFQRRVIDDQETATWWPNNFVDVHLDGTTVQRTRAVTVTVTNRESRANAIVLTNFQDTLPGTQPREQIRVEVPGYRRENGALIYGSVTSCVELPRLDGTRYFQVER